MKIQFQNSIKKKGAVPVGRAPVDGWRFRMSLLCGTATGLAVAASETANLDGLTRSDGRLVFVDDVYSQFFLNREMVLDHRLLPLTLGLRLAATTFVAELADADVRASAMNGAVNVVVLAFRGTRVANAPLVIEVADHPCTAVLTPLRGGNDGLLAIHLGLADEDETAGAKVTGVTNVTDLVLVLLGGPDEGELDAVDVHGAAHRHVSIGLALLFFVPASVEIDDTELVVVAISLSPAVGQLVLGLEHCGDGSDNLFLVCLDRNERQGCQLLVADNFHRAIPPSFKVQFCHKARGGDYQFTMMIPIILKPIISGHKSQETASAASWECLKNFLLFF